MSSIVDNLFRKGVMINGKRYVVVIYTIHANRKQYLFYTNGRRVKPEAKEKELLALI